MICAAGLRIWSFFTEISEAGEQLSLAAGARYFLLTPCKSQTISVLSLDAMGTPLWVAGWYLQWFATNSQAAASRRSAPEDLMIRQFVMCPSVPMPSWS